MTDPGPMPLPQLARRLHLPEAQVRESMGALCRHWGRGRVIAVAEGDTIRLTPAAVAAIHQSFGIRPLHARRGPR